jgi:Tol biopolymer transport system component
MIFLIHRVKNHRSAMRASCHTGVDALLRGGHRRRTVGWLVAALLAAVTLSACGDSTDSVDKAAIGQSRLSFSVVYEKDGDIYLRESDGPSRRVLENASYPRWSPDGSRFAAVAGRGIVVVGTGGRVSRVAKAGDPRAITWHPSGRAVFFSDGERVRVVDLDSGETRVVVEGYRALELDAGPGGRTLVATVRRLGGYAIRLFDLVSGDSRALSRGCSASLSPDGRLVTSLLNDHRRLELLAAVDGHRIRLLEAPAGITFDNHYWTNDPHWIAAETEGEQRDIILVNADDARVWRATSDGDAGRGDVFIRAGG